MPAFGPFMRRALALLVTMIGLAQTPAVADLVVGSVRYSYGDPLNSGNLPLPNDGVASGSDQGSTWAFSYSASAGGTSLSQYADYTMSISTGGDGVPSSLGFGGGSEVLSLFHLPLSPEFGNFSASMNGYLKIHLGTGDSLFYQIEGLVDGQLDGGGEVGPIYERQFDSPGYLTTAGDYYVSLDSPPAEFNVYSYPFLVFGSISTAFSININIEHSKTSLPDDPTTVIIDPGVGFSASPQANAVPEPSTFLTAAAGSVALLGYYLRRRGR